MEMVLSEVINFLDVDEFLNQASNDVDKTSNYVVPLIKETLTTIKIVVNDDGEWYGEAVAKSEGFEGCTLTVYKVDLDYEAPKLSRTANKVYIISYSLLTKGISKVKLWRNALKLSGALIEEGYFCFKRNRNSNKPFTNTGILNNRNIGGMSYEDQ
ncbi:hypothetical protein [Lederbergia panacisoli]|uniref:hypothetical protein n=1 Tax=Lederbergia panacisoli TaxID=1255251 RepID=UPI00214BE65E|nr:hypothetical protein [Lederbergia panacisoli]MCR2823622.1 hypothetical protein [Lederbergia panacisoli]